MFKAGFTETAGFNVLRKFESGELVNELYFGPPKLGPKIILTEPIKMYIKDMQRRSECRRQALAFAKDVPYHNIYLCSL